MGERRVYVRERSHDDAQAAEAHPTDDRGD